MKKQFASFLPVLSLLLAGSTVLSSCGKEDDAPTAEGEFNSGVFVTNEGQHTKSNGEVSFINRTGNETEQDLFSTVNGRPLGDVVQSISFHENKAYIIVNNSDKVEITDAATFKSVGVINDLKQPRYMVVANNKAYISCWVKTDYMNRTPGEIAVIDLSNNTIIKKIAVGWFPDQMLIANNKLFVPNSAENTLSVINLTTDAVESTLTVGDSPKSMVLDANNNIWVLCTGNFVSNISTLHRLHPGTNTVEATFNFPVNTTYFPAEDLKINAAGNTMFYNFAGKVYRMRIADPDLPTTSIINRYFYGIGIDPETNTLYLADAGNFEKRGKVIRYSENIQPIDSFTVGIAPNDFYFR